MPTQILFTFAALSDDYCFDDPQSFAVDIVNGLSGELDGDVSLFTEGNSVPSTANEDRLWHKLSADGSPDRWFKYWQGQWVSLHETPASGSERRIWVGTTGELETYDGGASGTVTPTTGPMWEVDTVFDAKFPFGVGTTANGTVVAVNDTGGTDEHTLTVPELPAHTHEGTSAVDTPFNVNVESGSPNLRIDVTGSTGDDLPHNNMPPYTGVYFIKRTLRKFHVAS